MHGVKHNQQLRNELPLRYLLKFRLASQRKNRVSNLVDSKWDSWWKKHHWRRIFSEFEFPLLIIIPPSLYAHLSLLPWGMRCITGLTKYHISYPQSQVKVHSWNSVKQTMLREELTRSSGNNNLPTVLILFDLFKTV